LKDFVANVFAHVAGKTMVVGRLLTREAAQAYLRECRERFSARGDAEP
jgi:hypothetical protein